MIHWKRFIIVLLTNICLMTLSYVGSKDVQVTYSKSLYNQDLKEELYENLKKHKEKFAITFRGNTEQIDQQLEYIMNDLQYEDPYVYENMVDWRANYSYTSKKATVNFFVTYLLTQDEEQFVTNEVKRLARQLTNDQMSDLAKIKEIHDYVVRNTEYSSDTISSQYSPYTILTEQKGVCQAYAFLIYRLLQEADVEVLYVKGMAGGGMHAWNLVKLNDEWYHVDATWNETIGEEADDQYFLVTDQQMKLTHSWNDTEYPSAIAKLDGVREYIVTEKNIEENDNEVQRGNPQHFMAMPL